jgi:hypothetical protein
MTVGMPLKRSQAVPFVVEEACLRYCLTARRLVSESARPPHNSGSIKSSSFSVREQDTEWHAR